MPLIPKQLADKVNLGAQTRLESPLGKVMGPLQYNPRTGLFQVGDLVFRPNDRMRIIDHGNGRFTVQHNGK